MPQVVEQLNRGVVIRAICLRRGLPLGELARQAGVSRTTVHHLADGSTERPHTATLSKIAEVLDIDPAILGAASGNNEYHTTAEPHEEDARQAAFDRSTNTVVDEVYRDRPQLFASWDDQQWAELYSTFGTGGQLSREGVTEVAQQMNRKREIVAKLHVVLETHLAEIASSMIETLFENVQIETATEATPVDHRKSSRPGRDV